MTSITYNSIGVVRSDHTEEGKTPIQPAFAKGCPGCAIIDPEYEEGLKDIEGFSHIYLLYHFHRAAPSSLTVKPFLEDITHGVFATRSARRPNAIGMSLVRLVRRERNVLFLEDVDILDGAPLLDIKPFVPRFDMPENARGGWTEKIDEQTARIRGRKGYPG